jgi:protocatechuate 3,4-dioxygenase beta subunit
VLEQSGIVRRDIRSSFGGSSGTAQGVPMTLELVVSDLAHGGTPFAGVAVYVWHCDRDGGYSLYSDGIEDQNYLRGVQIADSDGRVTFTSIFPACYSGRWPHIHFEVHPDEAGITDTSNVIATSQLRCRRRCATRSTRRRATRPRCATCRVSVSPATTSSGTTAAPLSSAP